MHIAAHDKQAKQAAAAARVARSDWPQWRAA
jgi:hypothetical protein